MSKIRTVATVAILAAVVFAFAGCKKSPTQKAADKTARAVDKVVEGAKEFGK